MPGQGTPVDGSQAIGSPLTDNPVTACGGWARVVAFAERIGLAAKLAEARSSAPRRMPPRSTTWSCRPMSRSASASAFAGSRAPRPSPASSDGSPRRRSPPWSSRAGRGASTGSRRPPRIRSATDARPTQAHPLRVWGEPGGGGATAGPAASLAPHRGRPRSSRPFNACSRPPLTAMPFRRQRLTYAVTCNIWG